MSQSNVDALGWKAGCWGEETQPSSTLWPHPAQSLGVLFVQLMDGEKDYREYILLTLSAQK